MSRYNDFVINFKWDLREALEPISVMQAVICFILIFAVSLACCKLFSKKTKFVALFLISAYLTIIFSLTLLTRTSGSVSSFDTLFVTVSQAIDGFKGSIYSLIYNILLFVPLSFLIAFPYGYRSAFALCFCVSLSVELAQLFTGRGVFEISDLICNILGAALGLLVAILLRLLYEKSVLLFNIIFKK